MVKKMFPAQLTKQGQNIADDSLFFYLLSLFFLRNDDIST